MFLLYFSVSWLSFIEYSFCLEHAVITVLLLQFLEHAVITVHHCHAAVHDVLLLSKNDM